MVTGSGHKPTSGIFAGFEVLTVALMNIQFPGISCELGHIQA